MNPTTKQCSFVVDELSLERAIAKANAAVRRLEKVLAARKRKAR